MSRQFARAVRVSWRKRPSGLNDTPKGLAPTLRNLCASRSRKQPARGLPEQQAASEVRDQLEALVESMPVSPERSCRGGGLKLVRACDLTTSIPSVNFTPRMTFGNWLWPSRRRQRCGQNHFALGQADLARGSPQHLGDRALAKLAVPRRIGVPWRRVCPATQIATPFGKIPLGQRQISWCERTVRIHQRFSLRDHHVKVLSRGIGGLW